MSGGLRFRTDPRLSLIPTAADAAATVTRPGGCSTLPATHRSMRRTRSSRRLLTYPAVGLSRAAMGNSAGRPWACWMWRCARAPGLTLVHDPRVGSGAGDEMFDGVIPLGEALRPLDLSRPSTRVACRQQSFGSQPRRIGVSEGLTRAEGCKFVFGSSGLAGTGCRIAQPKPGSSGQRIRPPAGCRGLGRG